MGLESRSEPVKAVPDFKVLVQRFENVLAAYWSKDADPNVSMKRLEVLMANVVEKRNDLLAAIASASERPAQEPTEERRINDELALQGYLVAPTSSDSPSNSVMVPRELTAENGAKAALSGEFTFEPYLGHDGKTLVPWDMIKQIHRKVVELYGTPSATQEQFAQSLAHHDAILERCAQIIEARAWLGQGNAAGAIRALKSAKAEGRDA